MHIVKNFLLKYHMHIQIGAWPGAWTTNILER